MIMKQKFNEAWEKQEERLSKFKTELTDSWCYSEYGPYSCGGHEYRYENGNLAEEMHYSDMENSRTVTRYDPEGNCVEKGSCKFVYYENSSQKEFEWRDDGIKHFDKQGNDDTKKYYLKHQIATKRIKAEGKGTTFSKMSKLEKAVAVLNVDKPELTMLEKMLLKKAKNRS